MNSLSLNECRKSKVVAGVYAILNTVSNRMYVGGRQNVAKGISRHFKDLSVGVQTMKGKVMSDETKRKIGQKSRDRKHTQEQREKWSRERTGRASSWKGRTASEETRMKMRISRLAYLERQRSNQ